MRIISNSFVGGEISPALFGRHDLKAYFQAARSIKNFIVRKTGGIKKRAGTQLLWRIDAVNTQEASFRVFPLFYLRSIYLVLVLYTKKDDSQIYYRLCDPNREEPGEEYAIPVAQISSTKTLADYKVKQIGDTIFFSCAGARSFHGKLDYAERFTEDGIRWEAFKDEIEVEDAPEMTCKVDGFESDVEKGFRPAVRHYALFGVKNGVYSKPTEVDANIYLYWVAGATVTLTFVPQWEKHDYYILAQEAGGTWGVMQSFYPNTNDGNQSDTEWTSDDTLSKVTVNGHEYMTEATVAGLSGEANALTKKTVTPSGGGEAVEVEYSTNALILDTSMDVETGEYKTPAITGTYKPSETTPILGIKLWWGGKLRRADDESVVDSVGSEGIKVYLYDVDADGNESEEPIAEWKTMGLWGEQSVKLTVDEPVAGQAGHKYRVRFESYRDNEEEISERTGTPIILRGIALLSDSATQKYVDTNINAGEVTGVQDPLTVGDTGMDCSLIDIWEQRMVMASSMNNPFTLWFSAVGDLYNFYTNRPMTASDAFSVTIPATTSSRILHMLTNRWFLLFTESGEYHVDAVGNNGFYYGSISIRRTSNVGCHDRVEPVTTEDRALFVAADGKTIYDIVYSLEQDNLIPNNRTMMADHLMEGKTVTKIVYKRFPEPELLCLLSDGTVAAMTYIPEQDVYAWHHHEFGYPGLRCEDINSTSTVHDSDKHETTSEILLSFRHEAHPASLYVERLRANSVGDIQDVGDAKCADHCGYSKENFPVAGEDPETDVEAELVTVRPELPDFNSMGIEKNIYDCVLRLNRSGAISVRPYMDDGGTLPEVSSGIWRTPDVDETAGTVRLLSKDVKVLPRAYHNTDGEMVIASADKWACDILSVLFNVVTADTQEGG